MRLSHSLRHRPGRPTAQLGGNIKTPVNGSFTARRGIVTDADVESARKYCVSQLRSETTPSHHIQCCPAISHSVSDLLSIGKVTTTPISSANSFLGLPTMPMMLCVLSIWSWPGFQKRYQAPP